ncbi:glycosyltransferase [Paenibacillus glufosinatiresistens]|uniref:glycosyltransferase n=1 Tax=Paenibacillus glufosinatiresistens TaxID=3070657 RepID=UPI00286E46E2|nr:glycosyltransferase [Paenibacillus sp. YX.27]
MNASIALCMIVKNEQQVLERCLDSVKHAVDEIIIVDTGSTDDTLTIARRYTDKIYPFAWTDNFSDARNHSIRQATKDYILVLDADEYLDPESNLQAELESRLDYYLLPIKSYLSGGESSTHRAVRLFANRGELKYENHLHEHLNLLDHPQLTGGESTRILIHHSGYLDEAMQEKDKIQRNLALMKKALRAHKDGYNLFNMGKTYMALEDYSKAVQCFKEAYPLSTGRVYLPELITKLSLCLGELGRNEEGLNILKDAVNLYPDETDMRYVQALLYKKAGYLKDAVAAYEACLKMGDRGSTVTEGAGSYKARVSLAEIYRNQRKWSEGFEQVLQALQVKSGYVQALRLYFEITLKAQIPAPNVLETIGQFSAVRTVEQLQTLLDVLYAQRHPLMEEILKAYQITAQPHIRMISKLYDRQYDAAYAEWQESGDAFPNEVGADLALLAYLRGDAELMKAAVPRLNASQREAKLLYKWIGEGTLDPKQMTSLVEELLVTVSERLLVLRENEAFGAVSRQLEQSKREVQCRLADILLDYGQDKAAFDLLVKLYENHPDEPRVLEPLGDLCCKLGYWDDAEVLYAKLKEQKPVYRSLERLYGLYESRRTFEGMRIVWQEIHERFPLSQWKLTL